MLIGALVGTFLGLIAGLIPGLHSNTFAAIIIANFAFLSLYLSPLDTAAMIITSAISYTIANIIPTIFIGVPSEDTAIGVLPTHEMVLEGRGFAALSISCFSSLIAVLISLPFFTTAIFIGKNYELFRKITPFVLITVTLLLIISEKGEKFEGSLSVWRKRLYAFLVFMVSGFLGYVALSNSKLAEVSVAGNVLLPLLTGLFGAPVLLLSTSKGAKVPEQRIKLTFPEVTTVFRGSLAGFFVSIFPGISSGVATVLASIGEKSKEGYISALSSANTANSIVCFFMLLTAGRTRSGAADALKSLNLIPDFWQIALLSILSGFSTFTFTMLIGYGFARKFSSVDSRKLSIIILVFLLSIVILLTGIFGLVIFLSAIPIGLSTAFLGIRRVNCMGCLILPILLYYLKIY
ncbi:MAG: tripartite tricarboxylate transporter permease [Archaeoglobaceae archaeon]|nr:tripartite tricarboxylate transporter permease [Archaeoglobaceae archaeon]